MLNVNMTKKVIVDKMVLPFPHSGAIYSGSGQGVFWKCISVKLLNLKSKIKLITSKFEKIFERFIAYIPLSNENTNFLHKQSRELYQQSNVNLWKNLINQS